MKKNTDKRNFRKYYPKLRREGIVRSALFGLLIGCGANFITATVAWFVGGKDLWLPIGVGIAVALITAIISYFSCYKPSIDALARRVDGLGLEERAITMLELQNDDSCIADLQRKDTLSSMEKLSARKLKIRPSKVVVILAAVFLMLGAGATTVVGLAAKGIVPDGADILPTEEPTYYEISYVVYQNEGGEILGETDQLLLPGEYASTVVAVAFDGYVFSNWNWLSTESNPTRQGMDQANTPSCTVTAVFVSIDDAEGEQGEGEPSEQPEEDGDSDENAPPDDQNDPNQDNSNMGESPDDSGDSGAEGSEGGGRWEDQNTIIDGTQ